jgi:hypothetical protein
VSDFSWDKFLSELTDLTLKYGVSIGGCGCCGSPWLDASADTDSTSGYFRSAGGDRITWVDRGSVAEFEVEIASGGGCILFGTEEEHNGS